MLAVALLLTAPATLLQLGLRDSTAPWFFTNDSTYQIEQGGDLLLDLDNPYGHDYRESGPRALLHPRRDRVAARAGARGGARALRLLPRGRSTSRRPGGCCPSRFDDYRLLVLLCNLLMLAAALAFRGPLAVRLALGALLVCNPIAVSSAWFGQNDAPSLLLLVLAFALVSRRRFGWAAATLAGAVLLKQFALVAAPFLALMIWKMRPRRAAGARRSSSAACWPRASCRS